MRGETVTIPPCVGEARDDDIEGIFLRIGSSTSTEPSIEKLLSDLKVNFDFILQEVILCPKFFKAKL